MWQVRPIFNHLTLKCVFNSLFWLCRTLLPNVVECLQWINKMFLKSFLWNSHHFTFPNGCCHRGSRKPLNQSTWLSPLTLLTKKKTMDLFIYLFIFLLCIFLCPWGINKNFNKDSKCALPYCWAKGCLDKIQFSLQMNYVMNFCMLCLLLSVTGISHKQGKSQLFGQDFWFGAVKRTWNKMITSLDWGRKNQSFLFCFVFYIKKIKEQIEVYIFIVAVTVWTVRQLPCGHHARQGWEGVTQEEGWQGFGWPEKGSSHSMYRLLNFTHFHYCYFTHERALLLILNTLKIKA